MQLSNATVESLADGVLTLAFTQAGVASGFTNGGYDKDLSKALVSLFGISPRIATTLGAPPPAGQGTALAGTDPVSAGPHADPAPPAADRDRAGRGRSASGNGSGARGRPASAGPASAGPGSAGPGSAIRPADEDTDPGDQAAPEGLTGMDLIERELGGKVIEEIG